MFPLYTPLEAGEVIASCEGQLLKQKIISGPFTAKEIAKGSPLGSPHPGRLQSPPESKFPFTMSHLQPTGK